MVVRKADRSVALMAGRRVVLKAERWVVSKAVLSAGMKVGHWAGGWDQLTVAHSAEQMADWTVC
jgi:hypothetical protein